MGGTTDTVASRALRQHPHWQHWCALGALVTDGCSFLAAVGRSGARGRRAGRVGGGLREPLAATSPGGGSPEERRRGSSASSSHRSHSSKRSSSGKSSSKNKKDKGQKDSRKGKKSKKATTPPPPPPVEAPAPAAVAPEWKPTRTGHLAVGARETGVKVVL